MNKTVIFFPRSQQWYEQELRESKTAAEAAARKAAEAEKAVAERQQRLEVMQRRFDAAEIARKEAEALGPQVAELEAEVAERQRVLDATANRAAEAEAENKRQRVRQLFYRFVVGCV